MSFDNKLFKLGRDLGAFTVLSTSTRNLDRDTDQPRVVCCGANSKIFFRRWYSLKSPRALKTLKDSKISESKKTTVALKA